MSGTHTVVHTRYADILPSPDTSKPTFAKLVLEGDNVIVLHGVFAQVYPIPPELFTSDTSSADPAIEEILESCQPPAGSYKINLGISERSTPPRELDYHGADPSMIVIVPRARENTATNQLTYDTVWFKHRNWAPPDQPLPATSGVRRYTIELDPARPSQPTANRITFVHPNPINWLPQTGVFYTTKLRPRFPKNSYNPSRSYITGVPSPYLPSHPSPYTTYLFGISVNQEEDPTSNPERGVNARVRMTPLSATFGMLEDRWDLCTASGRLVVIQYPTPPLILRDGLMKVDDADGTEQEVGESGDETWDNAWEHHELEDEDGIAEDGSDSFLPGSYYYVVYDFLGVQ
mgnify:CR=1 FL=1